MSETWLKFWMIYVSRARSTTYSAAYFEVDAQYGVVVCVVARRFALINVDSWKRLSHQVGRMFPSNYCTTPVRACSHQTQQLRSPVPSQNLCQNNRRHTHSTKRQHLGCFRVLSIIRPQGFRDYAREDAKVAPQTQVFRDYAAGAREARNTTRLYSHFRLANIYP